MLGMSYEHGRVSVIGKKHLGLIPLTIFCVVWEKRNRRIFGVEEDVNKVKVR